MSGDQNYTMFMIIDKAKWSLTTFSKTSFKGQGCYIVVFCFCFIIIWIVLCFCIWLKMFVCSTIITRIYHVREYLTIGGCRLTKESIMKIMFTLLK